jgi:ribosomal-protein-alanine N-acetyltransferase
MTIIKTKYFTLRPLKLSDVKPYFESMQDKITKKGFFNVPKNLKEAKKEIANHIKQNKSKVGATFTIEVNGEYAGYVKIDYENWDKKEHRGRIHYCTHPKFRGKGITTKAANLVTEYGFKKLKLKRIIGTCRTYNKASARILEKIGYKLEGILKKDLKKKKKYLDTMLWAKVK